MTSRSRSNAPAAGELSPYPRRARIGEALLERLSRIGSPAPPAIRAGMMACASLRPLDEDDYLSLHPVLSVA